MQNLPHLSLPRPSRETMYRPIKRPPDDKPKYPSREDIRAHASRVRNMLDDAWNRAVSNEQVVAASTRNGVYLEFRGQEGFRLATEKLDNLQAGIRLLSVGQSQSDATRDVESTVPRAVLYVPKAKVGTLTKKLDKVIDSTGDTSSNQDLIRSIERIMPVLSAEQLWTDPAEFLPRDEPEWCEAWLQFEISSRDTDNRKVSKVRETLDRFRTLMNELGIESRAGHLIFQERIIVMIRASLSQLSQIALSSDLVAEFRRTKETAEYWSTMQNFEAAEWVRELASRIEVTEKDDLVVCILDQGVNAHPLLDLALPENHRFTVNEEWGVSDEAQGHGTAMAGLALYGDLQSHLEHNGRVSIQHLLESVKLLQHPGSNPRIFYGAITEGAVARVEIQFPHRQRVFCLAVTCADEVSKGRHSAWSAALDNLAFGGDDGPENARLIVVSAGNLLCAPVELATMYPQVQMESPIHDPAQAWNVVTVGAYTDLTELNRNTLQTKHATVPGLVTIAPKGGLSPFSSTSATWAKDCPYKPDIVMEGGNGAHDGTGFVETNGPSLSLLTTGHTPALLLTHFNMTSAAAAQAARFAAQIKTTYPDFWPETLRALMIHSAEWTPEMRRLLAADTKTGRLDLLRLVGFGVPNLERALYSASNSLTLISQANFAPYSESEATDQLESRMRLYRLPWPAEVLNQLPPETMMEMKVTLSYFIEPGPGVYDPSNRYRYGSHGLRFELNNPRESEDEFMSRVNDAMKIEEANDQNGRADNTSTSDYWRFGINGRTRGSIHSDVWTGTAADLATSTSLAVFPTKGWWRTRPNLRRESTSTRYSLVVSIHTNDETIDIYTPVAAAIKVQTSVPVAVG